MTSPAKTKPTRPPFDKAKINPYKIKNKTKEVILGILTAIILVGISYTILAPIIGLIAISFMSMEDMFNPLVFLVPDGGISLDNYRNAIRFMPFWGPLWRTLAYSLGMGVLQVFIASIVGYGFARFKFYGNKLLFGLVLLTFIIPPETYLVPLWFRFTFFGPTDINLIGNYSSMIILTLTGMGLRSGLFIYIFRQFFMGVPRELSEAAYIDGCSQIRTYALIMMPNAKPAIVTVLMFALVWHYGDTFYSSVLLRNPTFLHVALGQVVSNYMGYHWLLADMDILRAQLVFFPAVVLTIAPIMIIYAVMQRKFIEGIERSGIVG